MSALFHVALARDWARARQAGSYVVSTLGLSIEQVGFLHACADLDQVAGVLQRFYADVDDELVLLTIDTDADAFEGLEVRVEPAVPDDPASPLFPHVYGGALPTDAVVEVVTLPPRAERVDDARAHPTERTP